MNSDHPIEGNASKVYRETPDGKVYEYKLSLLANLLNPPELLVYRIAGLGSFAIWGACVIKNPNDIVVWILAIPMAAFYWHYIFRHGLPLYSRGKKVELVITEKLVALETNRKFFLRQKIRCGLEGGWPELTLYHDPMETIYWSIKTP